MDFIARDTALQLDVH